MIFFYGWRTANIGMQSITDHTCTHCNVRNGMFMETRKAYVHLFWIPIIPLNKRSYSFCEHCKQSLRKQDMPPDLKNRAKTIARETRTPWYFFLLPGLLMLLFLSLFVTSLFANV